MKKRVVALLMAAVMVASLAACGNPDDSSKGTNAGNENQASDSSAAGNDTADNGEKKVLRYGIESAPSGIFLEQYHQDQYNGYVTYTVYEGLTQADMEGKQEMLLAKDYEVSDDGKTYTFHLQEGVKWHDGEDFTADDVAFTYNFMADPDYTGFYSAYVAEIAGYDEVQAGTADTLSGVVVEDDYTVTITTTNVYSSLLAKIGNIKIIPEHIWKDVDVATADQQTDMIRNPIGTGAFKMGEFVPDQYVTLEANKDYWRGEPKLDEIIFVVINSDTVEAQLTNGEVDFYELLNINADDMKMYESEGLITEVKGSNTYQCMQVNEDNPLLASAEARQGLAYAIDRQGIVDSLLYGYGNVANTIYAESYWAHPGNDKLTCYEYDPEKAIETFESIGWSYDEASNTMKDPDGNAVTFRLFCPTGNKVREQSATVIQANLGDIGIKVDVETMEFATLLDILNTKDDPTNYDLALTGYGMGADPDVTMLLYTDGAVNYGRYSNEIVDKAIDTALQSADPAEQEAAWNEMAIEVSKTLPCVYLYNMDNGYVYSDKVVTCYLNTYWNAYNTYLWEVK